MGLFDKKYCDVCGEKIRFLGNRKLEDGNLCKDCAEKLSPWFSDRRRSTVEDIKAQLRYREENKAKVAAFRVSRTLGEGNLLCLDDQAGRFLVRRNSESLDNNPDVIELSQVTGCQVDVEKDTTEEKTHNAEGKSVSYNPPRYTYHYRFFLRIMLNHPWFDEIRFRINKSTLDIKSTGAPQLTGLLSVVQALTSAASAPESDPRYQKYAEMGEEMRRALLGAAPDAPEENDITKPPVQPPVSVSLTPPQKIACPACSAVSFPDEKGRCPYCGEKLI